MLLRQIKYYVSVVKNNSFTQAAEECYISQSAISQQIQALETDLGLPLLAREGRGFTMTPAGEYFYRQGLLLLDEAERLRSETMRIGGKTNRTIRIGYLSGYSGSELSRAIAEFSEKYPKIDIEILSGNHEELRSRLLGGEIEIALNDQRRAFSDEYFNHHLYTCLCFIEVSSRSPLAALEKVSVEELKRVPCILISSKEQRGNEQDFYQSYLGFSGTFLFAESLEEARLMVSANKGFLALQITKNSEKAADMALKQIPLYRNDNQVERAYYAFWPKARTTAEIEAFAEILKRKFAEH